MRDSLKMKRHNDESGLRGGPSKNMPPSTKDEFLDG
jgi:hypothetical protein